MLLPLFPVSPKSPQYNPGSCRGTRPAAARADDGPLLHCDPRGAGRRSGRLTRASQSPRGFSREFTEPGRRWSMSAHRTLPQHGSSAVNAAVTALLPQHRRLLLSPRHSLCSSPAPRSCPAHLLTFPRGKPGSHSSSGKHAADPLQMQGGFVLPAPVSPSREGESRKSTRCSNLTAVSQEALRPSKYDRHQGRTKELPPISLSFMS